MMLRSSWRKKKKKKKKKRRRRRRRKKKKAPPPDGRMNGFGCVISAPLRRASFFNMNVTSLTYSTLYYAQK